MTWRPQQIDLADEAGTDVQVFPFPTQPVDSAVDGGGPTDEPDQTLDGGTP